MIREPVDHAHVLAVTAQNPRRKGEHYLKYCGRLAVLAGLLEPTEVGTEPVGGWSSAGSAMETEEQWWDR